MHVMCFVLLVSHHCPVNPSTQLQLYVESPSVHVPLLKQGIPKQSSIPETEKTDYENALSIHLHSKMNGKYHETKIKSSFNQCT